MAKNYKLEGKERNLYFRTLYRLAQEAAESFTLWTCVREHFLFEDGDHDTTVTNEELLRMIAKSTRRGAMVTLFILIDNQGAHGRDGHNIFRMADMCDGLNGLSASTLRAKLDPHSGTIRKIRILRNHVDGHHPASDDWKSSFSGIPIKDIRALIYSILEVALDCAKALGIPKLSAKPLEEGAVLYFERMMKALKRQVQQKRIGREYATVEEWERQQEGEYPESD